MATPGQDDMDEMVAAGLFQFMTHMTETFLNSMFIRGKGPSIHFPPIKLDTAGKRPRFTHEVTPDEEKERFEDDDIRLEKLRQMVATNNPQAAEEYYKSHVGEG